MGGLSISAQRPDEWITLDAPCTTLELQYLQQPGGGSLLFTDNGGDPIPIQTVADAIGPGTFRYDCTPGDHHFEVQTADYAPVTLLGWVATQPGVTWEMIGINGAEAPLILKWDQKLLSQYLKDNSPALIVLAYGTNEAASPAWDEDSYRDKFASLIDTIHQLRSRIVDSGCWACRPLAAPALCVASLRGNRQDHRGTAGRLPLPRLRVLGRTTTHGRLRLNAGLGLRWMGTG